MNKYGTSYFPTRGNAVRYYRDYEGENAAQAVERKLVEGSIHIGKPPVKRGDVLTIEDCRYHITEAGGVRVGSSFVLSDNTGAIAL